ncbi:acyl-CoA carboxylase epsilon subunit [Kitasatospora sp. NPDC003701]
MPVDAAVDRYAGEPVLRIVRGRVNGEELAAITVALLRVRRDAAVATGTSRTVPRRACWSSVRYRAPSAWAAA